MSVNEKMTLIADAIRDKTGGTFPLSLDDMAAKIPEVYEEGEKNEYNKFWDQFQNCGKRNNYNYGFSGRNWGIDTFKPKYDIKPTISVGTFREFGVDTKQKYNLVDILANQNIIFDTSLTTSLQETFYGSAFSRLPKIDASNVPYLNKTFFNCTSLTTIDELVLKEDGSQKFYDPFYNNVNLCKIVIRGIIGENVSFSDCPLNHDSIVSIINALKDYSKDTSGSTHTLTISGSTHSTLTESERATIIRKGWTLNIWL